MNMRFFSILSPALLLFVSLPLAASAAGHSAHDHSGRSMSVERAEAERVYTTVGVVQAVHEAEGKVTLNHQPVPALNWPAMTMRFSLESPDQLEGLKPGDRVRVFFRNEGRTAIIVEIERLS
jgi:Cu(I)/Ag(I) efflux system protein CusF